jgi:hypothetical protein
VAFSASISAQAGFRDSGDLLVYRRIWIGKAHVHRSKHLAQGEDQLHRMLLFERQLLPQRSGAPLPTHAVMAAVI